MGDEIYKGKYYELDEEYREFIIEYFDNGNLSELLMLCETICLEVLVMSIRWRENGDLVCAAMSDPEEGDTYIDDRLHYQLSVISRSIVADVDHEDNGLWYWVHDEGHRIRGSREY